MARQGETFVDKGGTWGILDCDFCHKSFRENDGAKVFYSPSVFNGDDEAVMEICKKCGCVSEYVDAFVAIIVFCILYCILFPLINKSLPKLKNMTASKRKRNIFFWPVKRKY